MSEVYVARRRLKIGNEIREIGSLVPEAETWPRVESWIHTGYLDKIPGEYPQEEPKIAFSLDSGHVQPVKRTRARKRVTKE